MDDSRQRDGRPRKNRGGGTATPSRVLVLAFVIGTVILLTSPPASPTDAVRGTTGLPVLLPASSPTIVPAPGVAGLAPRAVNFSLSGSPLTLPSEFWGATAPVDAGIVANESDFIQATPARFLVWPGGGFGERYDPIAGILHGGGRAAGPAASNETAFIGLCRAVGCHAIFQVPGEINSSTLAARIVSYTENTLGFRPDYWEIGNEPALWRHFDLPWTLWNHTQAIGTTPNAYAEEVNAYGQAMRAVDPTIRILGLPGAGAGGQAEDTWFAAVAARDGAWIAGLAIHAYPAGIGPTAPSLSGFLGSLTDPNSLPSRIPRDRAVLNASCGRCGSLPLFVTELGSAVLSGTYDPYVEGFPDAVFLGAEVVQAVELNLTNIDTFAVRFGNPGSWENLSFAVRPSYTLFSELLARLGRVVQPLRVSGGVGGVYALEATRPGAPQVTDLLVVNANATSAIQLPPGSTPGFPGGPAEMWAWDSTTTEPILSYWPTGVPASVTVPPVGLLLVETSSPSAVPVTVSESGLAAGARWYLSVSNQTETSGSAQMTFFLPPGAYPVVGSSPVWLADGERRAEFTPGTVVVGASPLGMTVTFRVQYFLQVEVTPSGAGTATPGTGWYNESAPLVLRAVPHSGFVFVSWSRVGPLGYAGSVANASLSLAGSTVEVANFTIAAGGAPPDPAPAAAHAALFSGVLGPAEAIPLATALVLAAIILNFRARRSPGAPPNTGPPGATPSRSPRTGTEAGTPASGAGNRADDSGKSTELRRRAALGRIRRLTEQAQRPELSSREVDTLLLDLRRSLVLVTASRFDEAERILSESERALDSAG
ncbi:MAG: hypothetical protein L3K18_02240 [Thermoplasmata archaeon]|nr:hypothetical protein [Thermoplasmata archaeon]